MIRRLLADGSYQLRGITRNTSSKISVELIAQGVEMVTADLNELESVTAAFKVLIFLRRTRSTNFGLTELQDANIIFAVANYFEEFATSGPEAATRVEYAQGVNLAKAASATSTLEHFIWSTLPDRNAISKGKFPVPHCDTKAHVDTYIKKDTALLAKTTFLWPGFFAATMNLPIFVPNFLVRYLRRCEQGILKDSTSTNKWQRNPLENMSGFSLFQLLPWLLQSETTRPISATSLSP